MTEGVGVELEQHGGDRPGLVALHLCDIAMRLFEPPLPIVAAVQERLPRPEDLRDGTAATMERRPPRCTGR